LKRRKLTLVSAVFATVEVLPASEIPRRRINSDGNG
jgi:hypothetical protein